MLETLVGLLRVPMSISALVALGVLVGMVLRRTKLVELRADHGRSVFGGVMLITGIGALAFATTIAVAIALDLGGVRSLSPDWPIGVVLTVVFGGAGLFFMRGWLRTRWTWDAEGITHIEGKRATRLPWSAIVSLDKVSWHTWRATAADGQVYWSRYMIGWEMINDAIRKYRPDLARCLTPARTSA